MALCHMGVNGSGRERIPHARAAAAVWPARLGVGFGFGGDLTLKSPPRSSRDFRQRAHVRHQLQKVARLLFFINSSPPSFLFKFLRNKKSPNPST
ncbi:hypothetical protein F2Q70_00010950 [Brassica cretica]|uniref:Uncharacterized protein n=1 Tax=Brassica cretica TaxID=69181 RepID=A0A8S9M301_BRACR|nr:hypothetical protein F2Q70_00010950 [Brassica cretica]